VPAGPRNIGASLRRGRIAVHSTALSCYEPIDTKKYENSVAAEECGCRAVLAPDIKEPMHDIRCSPFPVGPKNPPAQSPRA
jgi:hypothetical protein